MIIGLVQNISRILTEADFGIAAKTSILSFIVVCKTKQLWIRWRCK
jgi:hypothetical protein